MAEHKEQYDAFAVPNMAQEFCPVEDIRDGMIVTKDKRYIKVVEVQPINFLLRSAGEQRDIILSFAELLRIAPVKLQFKSNANRPSGQDRPGLSAAAGRRQPGGNVYR